MLTPMQHPVFGGPSSQNWFQTKTDYTPRKILYLVNKNNVESIKNWAKFMKKNV